MIIGRNKIFVFFCCLVLLVLLYMHFMLGSFYFKEFFIGVMWCLTVSTFFNANAEKEKRNSYFYKAKKKRNIIKLIVLLKKIEKNKRNHFFIRRPYKKK